MILKDIYILKESNRFEIKDHEEATIDLELVKVPPCFHTLLVGNVLCGYLPIRNATVMVLDNDSSPCYQTTTDECGIYRLRNILEPGQYSVIVLAQGYNTSFPKTIFLYEYHPTCVSFQLTRDTMYCNGIVYGNVVDAKRNIPIEDAFVCLNSVGYGSEMIYKTRSNQSGQYLIYNIVPNNYKIEIEKHGYQVSNPIEIKVDQFGRVNQLICLLPQRWR